MFQQLLDLTVRDNELEFCKQDLLRKIGGNIKTTWENYELTKDDKDDRFWIELLKLILIVSPAYATYSNIQKLFVIINEQAEVRTKKIHMQNLLATQRKRNLEFRQSRAIKRRSRRKFAKQV